MPKYKQVGETEEGIPIYEKVDDGKSGGSISRIQLLTAIIVLVTAIVGLVGSIRTGKEDKPLACSFSISIIRGIYACGPVTINQASTPVPSSNSSTPTFVSPTYTPYSTNAPLPTYTPLSTYTPLPTYAIPTQAIIPTASSTVTCLTFNDLESLGNVLQTLESPPGILAGAQIAFKQDWVAPDGWIIHRNSITVQSVSTGDIASVWSPEACRPLIRSTVQSTSTLISDRFFPLQLQDSINSWSFYLGLSQGEHTISGIPFEMGHELNTRGCRQEISATTVEVAANIDSASTVYFLANAGNGFSSWEGEKIGEFDLVFASGQLSFDLILGENIRDWARNPQSGIVTAITSPSTVEVAYGTAYDGRAGRIDMITLSVPPEYRNTQLLAIQVVDTTGGYPSSGTDPCIQVQAITVETEN